MTSAKVTPKTLHVYAHGRDCNGFTVDGTSPDEECPVTIFNHDGYVVGGLGMGPQGSDDVEFSVDIETGKIIGWDSAAVKARIAELIAEQEEEEDDE